MCAHVRTAMLSSISPPPLLAMEHTHCRPAHGSSAPTRRRHSQRSPYVAPLGHHHVPHGTLRSIAYMITVSLSRAQTMTHHECSKKPNYNLLEWIDYSPPTASEHRDASARRSKSQLTYDGEIRHMPAPHTPSKFSRTRGHPAPLEVWRTKDECKGAP